MTAEKLTRASLAKYRYRTATAAHKNVAGITWQSDISLRDGGLVFLFFMAAFTMLQTT